MENPTLPQPAAALWAAKRSIVHAIPPEMFGQSIPPHLGGGTILAARWKHRISTEIDVLLPGRNTLIDLLAGRRPQHRQPARRHPRSRRRRPPPPR